MKRPEIMAPAGSFESLQAAIHAGCDSVYFGVQHLNMRARAANNFSLNDLPEVATICKKAQIKSYITLNTLLYQHDLTLMHKIVDAAKQSGITAVIIQDVAAMMYAREVGMPLQASTQLSISNYEAVKFYSQFADTIVLARELDLAMIKTICKKIEEEQLKGPSGELIKIEVFVHGALCVAQSGRCQMSLISNNTSAQRGACLQECRKKYRIIDEENGNELTVNDGYVLSPKDLCTLPFLDKLVDAGIDVFKIEGRGRSPEYVDVVVKTYAAAVAAVMDKTFTPEKVSTWMDQLKTVYNRGFSDGYFLGKLLPDWAASSGSQATEEKEHLGVVTHYFPKAKVAEIKIQAGALKIGDQLIITGTTTGIIRGTVTTMLKDEIAVDIANKKDTITIPLAEVVRDNDKVYLVKTLAR
jgi:putative protease